MKNLSLGLILPSLLFFVASAGADDAARRHWAWTPPRRPPIPDVRDRLWPRTPVDRFVLASLEKALISPAPPATREHLLRRVTFDLTGLPPTPDAVADFLADRSPDAYAKVVERLLASPAYGERWGRHWLDVARFAESNGYEFDEIRPDAWRYRDYVIDSLNSDKPYDRFVKEQLAGDELWPDDPTALVATGFNLLGADMTDSSDQAQRRQNTLNDMTDVAGLAFLGLTLNCARCHDHKFEPLPQTDYYRLQAFFAPATFRRDLHVAPPPRVRAFEEAQRAYEALARPVRDELARVEEPARKRLFETALVRLSPEAQVAHKTAPEKRDTVQRELVEKTTRFVTISTSAVVKALNDADRARHAKLTEELKKLESRRPAPLPSAMGLSATAGKTEKTYLLERGELSQRGDPVDPGFPVVLNGPTPDSGRRSALAAWLTSPDNPLTARVVVNRLWQGHFGRGLVATPNDFGVRGDRPTHPELLDWLATELIANDWSLKHLHRWIVLSATYQQSSLVPPHAADPDNHLVGRMNRRRLEGEAVRDALLAASGRLNRTMGGRGVFPPVPAETLRGTSAWPTSPEPRDHVRRSVYVFARRNLRFPFLEAFDLPDTNLSCPKRERSTTAPQALALLNSAEVTEAARALAALVRGEATTEDARLDTAWRRALGRAPSDEERASGRAFLGTSPLEELCRALFNSNEFVYRD